MTRLAKTEDHNVKLRYFVEEQIVATPSLLIALAVLAAIGTGDTLMGLRQGFIDVPGSDIVVPAIMVGVSYAALCVCTTLIFLDRRENTFCVPMHCGSSMLSGMVATWLVTMLYGQAPPSAAQLASAGLIVVALLFLSPLRHARMYVGKLKGLLARSRLSQLRMNGLSDPMQDKELSSVDRTHSEGIMASSKDRTFLFVCSGNTCRSAMAEVIGKAETASRLRIPFESIRESGINVMSAGVRAKPCNPMTTEAQEALRKLGFRAPNHSTRLLTLEMVTQAEVIYCMTWAQREAVIELFPSAAPKIYRLDPSGDIEDPIGEALEVFFHCAEKIRDLVRFRFDELGLQPRQA